jgi:hypothetical protein
VEAERTIDHPLAGQLATHDRQVPLAHPTLGERALERHRRFPRAGDQQHPRGLEVEPVGDLQRFVGKFLAQHRRHRRVVELRRRVHRDSGRLVERIERVVGV